MKNLTNERGVALVTSLLLTLISLAVIMALLYMVTWQTRLSAAHKQYKTAMEASQGGVELFAKQVIPYIIQNGVTNLTTRFSGIDVALGSNSSACMTEKISTATAAWTAACSADSKSFNPTSDADVKFTLQGMQGNFNVFTKIVDTVPGNSDLSGFELLDSGSGVTGSNAGISPMHIPAMYRIEVQGQKENNPKERSQLSVLYAY